MTALGYRIPNQAEAQATATLALRPIVGALALLVIAMLADVVARRLRLPVPGSVLGMAGLAVALVRAPRLLTAFAVAVPLQRTLPLLFVPLIVAAVPPALALGPLLPRVLLVIAVSTAAAAAAAAGAAHAVSWISRPSR